MYNQNIKKAIDKKEKRENLKYVFYSQEYKEYVATNGYVMFIEKTEDTYNSDCFFNPLTDKIENCTCPFPNYKLVLEDISNVTEYLGLFEMFQENKKAFISLENGHVFSFDYIKKAFEFVGADAIFYINEDNKGPHLLKSKDGLRIALVMNIKGLPNDAVKTGIFTPCDSKSKPLKEIYVSLSEKGDVLGVFSKESEAKKAGFRYISEFLK